jgi:hypothetical protein
MFARVPGERPHRRRAVRTPGGRLRRLAAVLAVTTGGLLAPAAAASAAIIPVPGPDGAYGPVPATTGGPVRVITVGGMPGWQITLIAVAAALLAATAAVFLDRARAGRRAASATR